MTPTLVAEVLTFRKVSRDATGTVLGFLVLPSSPFTAKGLKNNLENPMEHQNPNRIQSTSLWSVSYTHLTLPTT